MVANSRKFHIASVFMVHQISYSIFEVGGEDIPVMPLREKKEDPGTTNLLVPHRGRCLETREWQNDGSRAPPSGRMDT
ncbi:hypothetical protein TNCV_174661 [Trichonephila clavipes]|nr:hypothetical protein TNCV_174661 [Trichonephila clavipes]